MEGIKETARKIVAFVAMFAALFGTFGFFALMGCAYYSFRAPDPTIPAPFAFGIFAFVIVAAFVSAASLYRAEFCQ